MPFSHVDDDDDDDRHIIVLYIGGSIFIKMTKPTKHFILS